MGAGPKYKPSCVGYKVCPKCLEEKLLTTEFWVIQRSKASGWAAHCKICKNRWHKEHYLENRDKLYEQKLTYIRAHKEEYSIRAKKRNQKNRLLCLTHYSQAKLTCACLGCNENRVEFLTIDHINGKGNAHRKEIGILLYNWLIQNNYPEGFRVLCMNCNHSLGRYGYCPHEREQQQSEKAL